MKGKERSEIVIDESTGRKSLVRRMANLSSAGDVKGLEIIMQRTIEYLESKGASREDIIKKIDLWTCTADCYSGFCLLENPFHNAATEAALHIGIEPDAKDFPIRYKFRKSAYWKDGQH